jgi:hypothetical protein
MSIIPDAAKASTLKYTKFVIEHYRNYGPDSALCSYLANVTGSDDPSAFVPLSIRLLGSTLHEGFTTIWRQVLIYKVIDALHLVEAIKSEEERTGRLSQNLRRHGEIFERLRGVSGTRDLVLGVSEELAPNAFSSSIPNAPSCASESRLRRKAFSWGRSAIP